MEDAKGVTQKHVAVANFSSFTVEHIAPSAPSEPRGKRWSSSVELLLAIILNLMFLIALFYRPTHELQKLAKQPPAISVDLVPPPQPKPEQQKQQPKAEAKQEAKKTEPAEKEKPKPVNKYRESGGDLQLKPGRVEKVEADKSKVVPKKKAEKPKPEAPKTPEANVPDWAKALDPGYDLPKQADSSTAKSQGSNDQNSLSARMGEGGGDVYLNQLRSQILGKLRYPPTANGVVGVAQAVIVVDRAGHLQTLQLVRSTGRRDLDWAFLQAVRESAPFRPLPPDFDSPSVFTLTVYVAPS